MNDQSLNGQSLNGLAKIPATIITGFLGAGKTTIIRRILANSGGRRLALVINEFGDVGVDAEILKGCGDLACDARSIVELANGCICCTVADDFLPAIEQLLALDPPPEHIIIETSGLALPKPLVKAFDWPAIRSRLTVDGVIAIVDGAAVAAGRFASDPEQVALQRQADPSVDHDDPLEEVFGDQLLCADIVVVNKTDLIDEVEQRAVVDAILARAPRAKIVSVAEGRIEPAVLLGLCAAAEDDVENRPSCHDGEAEHDHDDFDSLVVEVGSISDSAAFMRRLAEIAGRVDVLRIKGFLDVRGKPMRLLVQGVGERLQHNFDRPWRAEELRRGRLVIIGVKGLDAAAVTGLLDVSRASA
ncbi:cobalamin biosynthesis protein CobW [Methylocapsa palsarum]|uniref:Cobalamin biosynthesis protein CobW n=1 Tax=Methylocapsa palsarum TaxID=1612308 RepID=A0A1I4BZS2_9HYPH|nr:cobalamin biosynthesis protein CobW [Methylocapsa palsarum]SFK73599.1 cobalamin biosynthesis protein CobW [Methylocapsa palsarum]